MNTEYKARIETINNLNKEIVEVKKSLIPILMEDLKSKGKVDFSYCEDEDDPDYIRYDCYDVNMIDKNGGLERGYIYGFEWVSDTELKVYSYNEDRDRHDEDILNLETLEFESHFYYFNPILFVDIYNQYLNQ